MTQLCGSVGIAMAAFIATDIDDLLLLAVLFATPAWHFRAIVMGQLLGIAALIAGSMVLARLAIAIPSGWIAVLGVIPLALGLSQLWSVVRARSRDEDDVAPLVRRQRRQVFAVAAITLANGADNIGVYVPLFVRSPAAMGLYATVFMGMTLVWLAAACLLVRHAVLGARIRRYGHILSPLVLIGLGIIILKDLLLLL